MKKVYERPVLRTASIVFGVFGAYGCDNGGRDGEGGHDGTHHRGGSGWWWWH